MHIIIDGYNLIRQSDHLRSADRRSLEAGRNALIQFLMPYKRGRGHAITIVFDAWDGDSPREERDRQGDIDIVYSRRGRKADDVIKEMVEKRRGTETVVVTSDRDISRHVVRQGTSSISSPEFERAVRRFYEGTAFPAEPEAYEGTRERAGKGTKKIGPARRSSRGARDYQKRIRKL
ncbi:MAG: NYN domain-containing protein [Deltaproteobacteria bacterium]|nr:NYN domain-containing protein [Deltaproteobacteria bacterium]